MVETLDLRGKNGFPTDERGFVYVKDDVRRGVAVGRIFARADADGWLIERRDGLTPPSEVSRHGGRQAARVALRRL